MKLMSSLSMAMGIATVAHAATIYDICDKNYLKKALAGVSTPPGITISPDLVTANVVFNETIDSYFFPDSVVKFCNTTVAYSHAGRDDQVLLQILLPAPNEFQSRWLSTGGGGYSIYSGMWTLPGGIVYGAASGSTDGGFGSFDTNADTAMLLGNGSVDYETLYMFAYKAQWEMSQIGKPFTKNVYNMTDDDRLYSYYASCSEGGREGWSQLQRFGDEWDGAAVGAPAFRWSFQQTQHLFSNIVEKTLDYYPPPCELDKIVNLTIIACDPLDGKLDGVIARSDLCLLQFDIQSTVGQSYYCAAEGSSTPAQNGTVSAEGAELVQQIIAGLKDSDGHQVYLSYQPGAALDDAETAWNEDEGKWELSIDELGGEYISLLVYKNSTTLESLDGVTYDTLREWMISGLHEYDSTLQTTWPDLSPFQKAGGKIIHYHGEADYSVPTASSVRYWESVRSIMYPRQDYNSSAEALNEWYRLFLIPGAGHCAPNDAMPNGPFPDTSLGSLIEWVENDVFPTTLNATVLQGEHEGENQQLCAWPLRPLWIDDVMECVYDQASIDTWHYDFDAIPVPVY
ncbi:tannase and feruloyl esterase family protein [Penicillium frequentans]|uniref:Carboxylic ester hydrolase n=1 Tax=Penicillium frequentans TaxID=3151616 RepID=A0AAD6D598_9EURO|nr:tannase and feruloyl esterase family protein [Penicillium glabrum]